MQAVVDCIERDGVEGITVREIAKEAGVNVAALNYYFRSKDALVAQVLKERLDHFLGDALEILGDEAQPAGRRVFDVLEYVLNGSLGWPRFMQAVVFSSYSDDEVGARVRESLGKVVARLGRVLDPRESRDSMARAAGLFSAVTLPALLPGVFDAVPGVKLSTSRQRSDFIRSLLGSREDSAGTASPALSRKKR